MREGQLFLQRAVKQSVVWVLILAFLTLPWPSQKVVLAAINNCSVSVSPTTVEVGGNRSVTFTVTNTDSVDIQSVRITAPNSNFEIINSPKDSWSSSDQPDQVRFFVTSGGITPGTNENFVVRFNAVDTNAAASWTVQASDIFGGGSTHTTCSGATSVSITAAATPTPSPTPDSGGGGGGGGGGSGGTSGGSSSGGSSSGGGGGSSSASAETAATPAPSKRNEAHSKGRPTPTPTVTPTLEPVTPTFRDTVPPQIQLNALENSIMKEPTEMSGTAQDNVTITRVDYSTDDGKNWLPVTQLSRETSDGRVFSFSFTPRLKDDGNYAIKVRARDGAGNSTVSPAQTVVIDQLPPQVNNPLFMIASRVIAPTDDGHIPALVDVPVNVTVSAVGGPVGVVAILQPSSEQFPLTKNPDTGLWSGEIKPRQAGVFTLHIDSIDGARNHGTRELLPLQVASTGQVVDANTGEGIADGTTTLYVYDEVSQRFVPWQAANFGQENPRRDGQYSFVVPPGRYYVETTASGYRTAKTDVTDISQTSLVSGTVRLQPQTIRQLWGRPWALPQWLGDRAAVGVAKPASATTLAQQSALIGQVAPQTEISQPGLLTFMTGWSPQTTEQLSILQELANQKVNVRAVLGDTTPEQAVILQKRGQYTVPLVADPHNDLLQAFQVTTVPTHIFINDQGMVTQVIQGVLNAEEIRHTISNPLTQP